MQTSRMQTSRMQTSDQELLRKPLVETTPARRLMKHQLAAEHGLHILPVLCQLPSDKASALKAAEAAAGLALPCDCSIKVMCPDSLEARAGRVSLCRC